MGEPQIEQVHSSSGPFRFWSLNGWRFNPSILSTSSSPWLKNTTWVVSCPVTRLQTEQWQVWLSIGSLFDWVWIWSHPPAYLCDMARYLFLIGLNSIDHKGRWLDVLKFNDDNSSCIYVSTIDQTGEFLYPMQNLRDRSGAYESSYSDFMDRKR